MLYYEQNVLCSLKGDFSDLRVIIYTVPILLKLSMIFFQKICIFIVVNVNGLFDL